MLTEYCRGCAGDDEEQGPILGQRQANHERRLLQERPIRQRSRAMIAIDLFSSPSLLPGPWHVHFSSVVAHLLRFLIALWIDTIDS